MCSCVNAFSRATWVRTSWKLFAMLFLKMFVAQSSTGIGVMLKSASFQFTANITITTTTVFMSLMRVNILDNNLGLPPRVHQSLSSWLRAGADTLGVILIFAILALMIFLKYGSVIFGG